MVDYSIWVKVDPLTVEQAARLWAGLDPTALLWREEAARLAPRLQMIFGAIKRGVVPADHRKNSLLAPSGYYERSEVSRSDLKAFAESIGERPAFLFYSEPVAPAHSGSMKVTNAPPPGPTLRGTSPWTDADFPAAKSATPQAVRAENAAAEQKPKPLPRKQQAFVDWLASKPTGTDARPYKDMAAAFQSDTGATIDEKTIERAFKATREGTNTD